MLGESGDFKLSIALAAAVLVAVAPPLTAGAQTSEPSTLTALEISEAIDVDGRLDEPAWQRAVHISNFTQRELNFGAPVSERTEVAILFDGNALYVGFWGFDTEPERIIANEMSRDFSWGGEDNFEIVIDSFNDDRNGFLFVTNPNGALADALISDNGGSTNRDWDGVWEVRARITEEGWFAEIRIPLSTLRYGPRPEEGWGINFERNIRRKREQVMWQGWSRDYNLEQVTHAGTLIGLRNLGNVRLLDVRPQGVGGIEWDEDEERQAVGNLGLDVLYLPSPSWNIRGTVNPDFAQVESDREEVNLTRFSLFFPEKREFFLEGQEFFDFELGSDTRPYYSRRIGLAADRTEIPIIGGGRVLGKRGPTTLGAMVLQTAAEEERGEPTANFGVFRFKQNIFDESSIGALLVSRIEPGSTNLTYGLDFNYATSEMFGERNFEAGLAVAQTYTSDADEQTGLAHRLYVAYPNDLVEISGSWARADESFDPQVGFERRTSYQRFGSEVAISPRPEFLPLVQQMEFKPWEVSYYIDDETHELQSFVWEVVPLAFTLRSGESFELGWFRRGERLDEPFELFEGAEIPAGEYWYSRWLVEIDSFSARPLSGDIEIAGGGFYSGEQLTVSLSGRWRASKYLTLQGDYEHNTITLAGDEFLVDEVGVRASYAFNPTLFGSVAAQWNNEDQEVIFNFRLNWIPEPGSDLFLVINEQAETLGSRWNPTQTTVLTKLVWRFAF